MTGAAGAEADAPVAAGVAIRQVTSKADRKAFLDLPYRAYRDLPGWIAPLRLERALAISPKQNLALAKMEHVLMIATRGAQVVGRISAAVNHAHLDVHHDATGHFGFLDTLKPDPELVAALIGAAEDWLRARGMERIAGPFNFSVNEECGLLVDGFDTPPVMMMPHGRPDYAGALERLGFAKEMDLYAYKCSFADIYKPPAIVRMAVDRMTRDPALEIRPLNMKDYKGEIALVLDIFNDAWSQNWGFIPFEADQIANLASEMKPLIRSDALWVGMIDGEPVAFSLILPNLNEVIDGLDGHLLPLGWLKVLYGLKVRGTRTGRLPLAGLRRAHHKTRRAVLLMGALFEAGFRAQHARGMREIEASWILETNPDMIRLISTYDAPRYKTYRIYGKAL